MIKHISKLLAKKNVREAISESLIYAENENDTQKYNCFINQLALFNQNEQNLIRGVITTAEYNNEIETIITSILKEINCREKKNVFISYNHKDANIAQRVKQALEDVGITVIIDTDSMRIGQDISNFIIESVKNADITVSLISSDSLLSTWVLQEIIYSGMKKELNKHSFLPCNIDSDFFNISFRRKALVIIDNKIKGLNEEIKFSINNGWGVEDIQCELSRYQELRQKLPLIIANFKQSLCVNLSNDNFNAGMQKLINNIKQINT